MKKLVKALKFFAIVLFSLIIVLIITMTIYTRIGNSHIKAQISGLGNRLVILTYQSEKTKSFKVALCINDKIDIKATIGEMCGARISTFKSNSGSRANQIRFFLEPSDEIIIKGTLNPKSIDYNIVKGNKLSLQYCQLQKELLPFFENEFELKQKYRQTHNPDYIKQFDSIIKISIPKKKLDFVKKHPDYELSADILTEDSYVSHDTIIKYSSILTDNVRKHLFGKMLFQLIDGWGNTKVGVYAPKFSEITSSGNRFTLDDLKGKYLILDFWGSWCGACIADIPNLKEYYKKYTGKIEIIAIACNDSKSAWDRAVKKNELEWINILNDKDLNDISAMYAITAFPTKFIIDKEGKILKKVVGESMEFYQIVDSLMNIK